MGNFNKKVLHQRRLFENLNKIILANVIFLKLWKMELPQPQVIYGIELVFYSFQFETFFRIIFNISLSSTYLV